MKNDRGFWGEVLSTWMNNIILYAKAEFKIIGIVYLIILLGLMWLGYSWVWLIALGITLLDLLPVIGSGMVFIPWVLYEWVFGNPQQGWWLLLLYVFVAVVKQFIEPYFLGKDLQLPFWMPFLILFVSTLLFNVFGILVASLLTPLVAAYRQVSIDYRR